MHYGICIVCNPWENPSKHTFLDIIPLAWGMSHKLRINSYWWFKCHMKRGVLRSAFLMAHYFRFHSHTLNVWNTFGKRYYKKLDEVNDFHNWAEMAYGVWILNIETEAIITETPTNWYACVLFVLLFHDVFHVVTRGSFIQWLMNSQFLFSRS